MPKAFEAPLSYLDLCLHYSLLLLYIKVAPPAHCSSHYFTVPLLSDIPDCWFLVSPTQNEHSVRAFTVSLYCYISLGYKGTWHQVGPPCNLLCERTMIVGTLSFLFPFPSSFCFKCLCVWCLVYTLCVCTGRRRRRSCALHLFSWDCFSWSLGLGWQPAAPSSPLVAASHSAGSFSYSAKSCREHLVCLTSSSTVCFIFCTQKTSSSPLPAACLILFLDLSLFQLRIFPTNTIFCKVIDSFLVIFYSCFLLV